MNNSFSAHTSIQTTNYTYCIWIFVHTSFSETLIKDIVSTFFFHYRRKVRIVHCDMSKCLWLMNNKNKTTGVVRRQAQNKTSLSLKMLWATSAWLSPFWMLCKQLLSYTSVIKVSSCEGRSKYSNRTLGIVIQSSKCAFCKHIRFWCRNMFECKMKRDYFANLLLMAWIQVKCIWSHCV